MKSNLALLASVSVLALTIGAAKADTIDFIGAEISYTVPVSGLYDITAYGAQGGPAVSFGGLGAEAGGDIFLSAGTTLTVLAGGQGAFAAGSAAAGAAAASFSREPLCSWRPAAAGAAAFTGNTAPRMSPDRDWRPPQAAPGRR